LLNHPGRVVTESEIAQIFTTAYGKAATADNASSAFAKTSINPYNPNIFKDEDFLPADVTDNPIPSTSTDVDNDSAAAAVQIFNEDAVSCVQDASGTTSELDPALSLLPATAAMVSVDVLQCERSTDPIVTLQECADVVSSSLPALAPTNEDLVVVNQTSSAVVEKTSECVINLQCASTPTTFCDLIPTPKYVSQPRKRKRTVAHAFVVTGTPHKKYLEDVHELKLK
jgi:hypothetical protein